MSDIQRELNNIHETKILESKKMMKMESKMIVLSLITAAAFFADANSRNILGNVYG